MYGVRDMNSSSWLLCSIGYPNLTYVVVVVVALVDDADEMVTYGNIFFYIL